MWGQANPENANSMLYGIIPTRVGTSEYCVYDKQKCEDHPHACGDKCSYTAFKFTAYGSSPRVWGQVADRIESLEKRRIIPTRVGTRWVKAATMAAFWDHPHACGDKSSQPIDILTSAGSSPRVWGQADFSRKLKTTKRIIPTRVGTRIRYHSYYYCCEDHPHACGDKCFR